jgi:O-antigen/teichoic acid export membrane protein
MSFPLFFPPLFFLLLSWHEKQVNTGYFDKVRETVTSLLTIGFATIVVLRKVLIIILGKADHGAELLLPFLLLMPVMTIISETTVLGICFSKKTKYNLFISAVVALVNLGGNIILVPHYNSLGASISTGFSYILYMFLRTFISRAYWYKFQFQRLIINSVLIIALTAISLFNISIAEIVIFVIIIIYNREYIKKMIHFIWKT